MQHKIINFLSQWKVIIPLAMVVMVWFFWPQPRSEVVKRPNTAKSQSLQNGNANQEIGITALFGKNKKLKCEIKSATAFIDDTKVSASLTENKKQNRVIFDGDCLYRWTNGSGNGERSCGLKSYIPIISQFVNKDSLQKVFPQANELTASCKEVSIIKGEVFEIPKKVLFKNKKLF